MADLIDPDEEPTKPYPPETTAQIAEMWQQDIATSERPTKNIRPRVSEKHE